MASPEVITLQVPAPYGDIGRAAIDPTLAFQQLEIAQRLSEAEYVDAAPDFHTAPSVVAEVKELIAAGVDIKFTNPLDIHALDPDAQLRVDTAADQLAHDPNGAAKFLSAPAMAKWGPLTKRAIALHTLYGASTLNTLGEGISPAVYEKPLFPKADGQVLSAADIIRAEKAARPEKAEQIITSYTDFVQEPIDPDSRLFYQGSMDARAVRTRALTATEEVVEHFAHAAPGTKMKSASLACGAAGPVKDLVQAMEDQKGVE